MALPVILVNATGGSDSLASGAGPGTALTGTSASFSGATVTLDGSPDLSGVATDGSHVLFLVTSTGTQFFKITAKDDGADTVDVTPNPAGTSTGRTWAIGGKRASIGSASSRLLVEQAASAVGDALAGWAIEFQSGHTETIAATLNVRVIGDTTSGPFILRGESGAGTKPILTFSNNGDCISVRNVRNIIRDFTLKNTNATKTSSRAIVLNADRAVVRGMTISDATDKFFNAIDYRANAIEIRDNDLGNCAGDAIESGTVMNFARLQIHGNRIHDNTGIGLDLNGDTVIAIISYNVIEGNGGDGIFFSSSAGDVSRFWEITNNTINGNTGDGIEIANNLATPADIKNNQLTNNGGYGLKFSHASATATYINGSLIHVSHNNTYNNTSGGYLPSSYGTDDPGVDPDYVSATDFTPQEPTLEGTQYPVSIP